MNRLEELLSSINDAVWYFHFPTREYYFINQRLADIYETSVDAIKQNPDFWLNATHPDDVTYVRRESKKVYEMGQVNLEYRIVVNGKLKWITDKKTLITDDNNSATTLFGTVTDITTNKKAELRLADSEHTYRYLFVNHPSPLWIYDRHTLQFLAVNNAAIAEYGYTRDEFLGMTIADIRPSADVGLLKEKVKEVTDSYKSASIWRHLRKDGSVIWVNIIGHGITYHRRKAEMVLAINVTEEIRNKEELLRREKLLSSMVESQTNYLVRLDTKGNFTFVNNQLLKKLNYSAADLIGYNFCKTTLSDDDHLCAIAFRECNLNPGKIVTLTHRKLDTQKNIFWTSWEFIGISNAGNNIEIQGIGRDITEELKNKEEIKINEKNLEALINNTYDLIWSIDKNYRLISANKAFKDRIYLNSGVQMKAGDNVLFSDQDKWKEYYDRALTGEIYTVNEDFHIPNGFVRAAEISFNPIHNAKDQIIGVGCFGRDITERANFEQEILKQNIRLLEIASLASHDVRGPVTSILGLINLFNTKNMNDPFNVELVGYLQKTALQLDAVIHKIVDKTYEIDLESDITPGVPHNQSERGSL